MKTLSVKEATEDLSRWLRRAAEGEQIAVSDGSAAVLLQPVRGASERAVPGVLSPREALRRLQSTSRLAVTEAEFYLRETRAERDLHGESGRE